LRFSLEAKERASGGFVTYVVLVLHIGLYAVPDAGPVPRATTLQTSDEEAAQRAAELEHVLNVQEPGAKLRIRLLDGRLREGELQALKPEALTIVAAPDTSVAVPEAPQRADVPLGDVETLWVGSDRAQLGTAVGFAVGAAIGVALAFAIGTGNESLRGESSSSGASLLTIPLTTAFGGLAGWHIGKRSRTWGNPVWTVRTEAPAR
jgi:hypothetical protein